MLTKTDVKSLQKDYIPNGRKIRQEEFKSIKFRRTEEYEVYQCGMTVDDDPQSGPIYCGDLVEWISEIDDMVICLCERHAPPKYQRVVNENQVL